MAIKGPAPVERVTDYDTKRALAGRFARHPSARLLLGASVVAVAARVAIGRWAIADLVAVGIGLALVGVVEWIAHRVLFHAPAASRRSRLLNTGASHRRHHRDPTDLAWVLLQPSGARALMVAVLALVAAWSVPTALALGVPPAGPVLSAVVVGWLAIAHYEWTHLLVHSRYRPRTRHYRTLARHHRLHHYRNERFWLGVTTDVGDRLFGTLPSAEDEVGLSDTARSLS